MSGTFWFSLLTFNFYRTFVPLQNRVIARMQMREESPDSEEQRTT